jgi:hypothetical protein
MTVVSATRLPALIKITKTIKNSYMYNIYSYTWGIEIRYIIGFSKSFILTSLLALGILAIRYSLLPNHIWFRPQWLKFFSNTLQTAHVILHLYVYKYYFYIQRTVDVLNIKANHVNMVLIVSRRENAVFGKQNLQMQFVFICNAICQTRSLTDYYLSNR